MLTRRGVLRVRPDEDKEDTESQRQPSARQTRSRRTKKTVTAADDDVITRVRKNADCAKTCSNDANAQQDVAVITETTRPRRPVRKTAGRRKVSDAATEETAAGPEETAVGPEVCKIGAAVATTRRQRPKKTDSSADATVVAAPRRQRKKKEAPTQPLNVLENEHTVTTTNAAPRRKRERKALPSKKPDICQVITLAEDTTSRRSERKRRPPITYGDYGDDKDYKRQRCTVDLGERVDSPTRQRLAAAVSPARSPVNLSLSMLDVSVDIPITPPPQKKGQKREKKPGRKLLYTTAQANFDSSTAKALLDRIKSRKEQGMAPVTTAAIPEEEENEAPAVHTLEFTPTRARAAVTADVTPSRDFTAELHPEPADFREEYFTVATCAVDDNTTVTSTRDDATAVTDGDRSCNTVTADFTELEYEPVHFGEEAKGAVDDNTTVTSTRDDTSVTDGDADVTLPRHLKCVVPYDISYTDDDNTPVKITNIRRLNPGEASAPAVTAPAVTAPAVTAPAVTAPAVTVPAVTAPAVTAPAVTAPAFAEGASTVNASADSAVCDVTPATRSAVLSTECDSAVCDVSAAAREASLHTSSESDRSVPVNSSVPEQHIELATEDDAGDIGAPLSPVRAADEDHDFMPEVKVMKGDYYLRDIARPLDWNTTQDLEYQARFITGYKACAANKTIRGAKDRTTRAHATFKAHAQTFEGSTDEVIWVLAFGKDYIRKVSHKPNSRVDALLEQERQKGGRRLKNIMREVQDLVKIDMEEHEKLASVARTSKGEKVQKDHKKKKANEKDQKEKRATENAIRRLENGEACLPNNVQKANKRRQDLRDDFQREVVLDGLVQAPVICKYFFQCYVKIKINVMSDFILL